MLNRRFFLVLVAVLLASACGGDDDTATTTSTTRRSTTTTSSTTSTSSTSSTTSTTAAATTSTSSAPPSTATTSSTTAPDGPSTTIDVSEGAPTPEEAATSLYAAWKAGDKGAAAKVAEPSAINTLFARTYTGPDEVFLGCEDDGDTFACAYLYEGGANVYRVQGQADAGYRVVEINALAD